MIKIENLSVAFDDVEVVKKVNFEIADGEILGVVGESGSGKSVTALTMMGLVSPTAKITSGKVLFNDTVLLEAGKPKNKKLYREYQGDKMSMVFQEPMTSLNPTQKVGKQVEEMLTLHVREYEKDVRKEKVLEALNSVGLHEVDKVYDSYPHQLSGGMRQRVMIAMAIILHPDLVVCDEPTTALDVSVQSQIIALLKEINQKEKNSMLFITHDLNLARRLCNRVIVMKDGEIVESGDVEEIFSNPKQEYTKMLISAVPSRKQRMDRFKKQKRSEQKLQDKKEELIKDQIKQKKSKEKMAAQSAEAVLKTGDEKAARIGQEKEKQYQKLTEQNKAKLDDKKRKKLEQKKQKREQKLEAKGKLQTVQMLADSLTDEAKSGEDYVILDVQHVNVSYMDGGNSLFSSNKKKQIIFDANFQIKKGEILGLVGESGCGKTTLSKAILGMNKEVEGKILHYSNKPQMVFQDPYSSLNPTKTIGWLLQEPLRAAATYDKQFIMTKEEREEAAMEMLKKVGLSEKYFYRKPSQLSGGQRQRVSIGQALITRPGLVIADEPVSALDVTIQAQIMELLRKLQAEMGISFLFISHDMNVMFQMSDRVMVMKEGRIVEIGDTLEVFDHPTDDYTKKLLNEL